MGRRYVLFDDEAETGVLATILAEECHMLPVPVAERDGADDEPAAGVCGSGFIVVRITAVPV